MFSIFSFNILLKDIVYGVGFLIGIILIVYYKNLRIVNNRIQLFIKNLN